MEAQHTPGPWKVFTTSDGSKVIGIGDRNGEGVADCGFGIWRGGSEEALANARLIAAAPDLLSALKALMQVHRDQDTVGVMPADKAIAYGKAEAALARAEART